MPPSQAALGWAQGDRLGQGQELLTLKGQGGQAGTASGDSWRLRCAHLESYLLFVQVRVQICHPAHLPGLCQHRQAAPPPTGPQKPPFFIRDACPSLCSHHVRHLQKWLVCLTPINLSIFLSTHIWSGARFLKPVPPCSVAPSLPEAPP